MEGRIPRIQKTRKIEKTPGAGTGATVAALAEFILETTGIPGRDFRLPRNRVPIPHRAPVRCVTGRTYGNRLLR